MSVTVHLHYRSSAVRATLATCVKRSWPVGDVAMLAKVLLLRGTCKKKGRRTPAGRAASLLEQGVWGRISAMEAMAAGAKQGRLNHSETPIL